MSKTCLRLYADTNQINKCIQDLNQVSVTIKRMAIVLNLAGNEVRLKILYILNKESKMCPCDLSDILNMTVPAISQHLKKLKDAGMVSTDKVGQTIFYTIIPENYLILKPIFNLMNQ